MLAHKNQIKDFGYSVIDNVYSMDEVSRMIHAIERTDNSGPAFRRSGDVFAIRQFLKSVPGVSDIIFNVKLKSLIHELLGNGYFVVKSIYFDKPEGSNWFVSYHQDLTISVDRKVDIDNYGFWTKKHNQFAVQPPIDVLENIFTIRIHLDDTDNLNGALKVIPKSHLMGIYRPETINWSIEKEVICNVSAGGVMIMKPLLLHGSNKTTSNKKRRVIHVEFASVNLPENLGWSEKLLLP